MNPARRLALATDPALVLAAAGFTADAWQQQVLRSTAPEVLMLCSRQSGKSLTAAALGAHQALFVPRSRVLVVSAGERQAQLLFKRLVTLWQQLGEPVPANAERQLSLELSNGSEVIALPGKEQTIRGFSDVSLLLLDEASRIPDPVLSAVTPMLAVGGGRLVALSTPWGARGWFHDRWHHPDPDTLRVMVTADQCSRLTPAFLAKERRRLGERAYREEYECAWLDPIGAVFSTEAVHAALDPSVTTLFPTSTYSDAINQEDRRYA